MPGGFQGVPGGFHGVSGVTVRFLVDLEAFWRSSRESSRNFRGLSRSFRVFLKTSGGLQGV